MLAPELPDRRASRRLWLHFVSHAPALRPRTSTPPPRLRFACPRGAHAARTLPVPLDCRVTSTVYAYSVALEQLQLVAVEGGSRCNM